MDSDSRGGLRFAFGVDRLAAIGQEHTYVDDLFILRSKSAR